MKTERGIQEMNTYNMIHKYVCKLSLYLRKCGMLLRAYEARFANIYIYICIDMSYSGPVFSQWPVDFIVVQRVRYIFFLHPSTLEGEEAVIFTIFLNQIIHKYSDRAIEKNPNRHRTTKLDI